MAYRYRHSVAILLMLAVTGPVPAAPALERDVIDDLQSLESQLNQGASDTVAERALAQSRRLTKGNAADRWAGALYLQLVANAQAEQGNEQAAADLFAQARDIPGIKKEYRDRWLHQEALLRLRAKQTRQGLQLLERWLEAQPDAQSETAEARWQMAQGNAALEHFDKAADWTDRALEQDADPNKDRLSLAVSLYQRAGRDAQALDVLQRLLEGDGADQPSAKQWRQAAALAQRAGNPGLAAALWEAGWRQGVLQGNDDLEQRIRLHLAAGTPARAAELLANALEQKAPEQKTLDEEALKEEVLEKNSAHRRLLAQAWEAARDRKRALAAWQALAKQSQDADDWLHLGQLAFAWGKDNQARNALAKASELGSQTAGDWLALFTETEKVETEASQP